MKKTYKKPMVVSDNKNKKKDSQKPLYLADGRWCCKVANASCQLKVKDATTNQSHPIKEIIGFDGEVE